MTTGKWCHLNGEHGSHDWYAGKYRCPGRPASEDEESESADELAELAEELTKARQALWPLLGNCPDCGRAVDRASVAVETAIEKVATLRGAKP